MAASTCEGATLPDEQAEPDDTATPARSKRDHRGLGLEPGTANSVVFGSRCRPAPKITTSGGRRRSPPPAGPAAAHLSRLVRLIAPAAAAAAPKPAMPATFSVPARTPRSWPPPRSADRQMQARRAGSARRRPGPADLVRGQRQKIGAQRLISTAIRPGAWTASTCRSAAGRMHESATSRTGWTTPVSLLASITETSARPSPRASASQRVADRPRPAVDRNARPSRRETGRPRSTDGCSIAETSSRRAGCPRRRMPASAPGVRLGAAGGEDHTGAARADQRRDLRRALARSARARPALGVDRGWVAGQRPAPRPWRRAPPAAAGGGIPVEIGTRASCTSTIHQPRLIPGIASRLLSARRQISLLFAPAGSC